MKELTDKSDTVRSDSLPIFTIDYNKILRNYCYIASKLTNNCDAAAVLKSHGYGLSNIGLISKMLYGVGCKNFFVGSEHEAREIISEVGSYSYTVFVLFPNFENLDLNIYYNSSVYPVINSLEDFYKAIEYSKGLSKSLNVAVKINSGMNRLGLSEEQLGSISYDDLSKLNCSVVISHLACGQSENSYNDYQYFEFINISNKYFPKARKSLLASNLLTVSKGYAMDMVRIGAGLYGLYSNKVVKCHNLEFPFRVQAKVLSVFHVDKGQPVGYGCSFIAKEKMRVATVCIGFADGVSKSLGHGRFYFKFQGNKLYTVGAISMNLTTVDLTNLKDDVCFQNSWVDVIDSLESFELCAMNSNSSLHETLCRFGSIYKKVRIV